MSPSYSIKMKAKDVSTQNVLLVTEVFLTEKCPWPQFSYVEKFFLPILRPF